MLTLEEAVEEHVAAIEAQRQEAMNAEANATRVLVEGERKAALAFRGWIEANERVRLHNCHVIAWYVGPAHFEFHIDLANGGRIVPECEWFLHEDGQLLPCIQTGKAIVWSSRGPNIYAKYRKSLLFLDAATHAMRSAS